MILKKSILVFQIPIIAFVLMAIMGCSSGDEHPDALLQSRVDALNKAAFTSRYNDAEKSEEYAFQALSFINDSLPEYDDGRLRAWNNLAVSYFNRAIHDSVDIYIDSVLQYQGRASNKAVEQTLSKLLKARQLQRRCDIAGCYQILFDIEQSGLLEDKNNNLLHNLAVSEFYIATTTLNYHYRNKSQYQQAELLEAMERLRDKLHCDYSEDLSFNYAIAYGYYALCSDTAHQSDYLAKALNYCDENIKLLNNSSRYSTYHLANTYQLLGFMLWSQNISDESWRDNATQLIALCDYISEAFSFEILKDTTSLQYNSSAIERLNSQLSFSFLREATALFFLHDDPYQRLGAIISTGRLSMSLGDTATARDYFEVALADSSMLGLAPKFEAMLYEGLLTAGCASDMSQVSEWTSHELQLLDYIKNNEKADFLLQQKLSRAQKSSVTYLAFTIVLAALAIALLTTLLLLRRRTKALQRETTQLQEANQRDVERIANVETCLSVLRHDITPFVSYLQNDSLPDELRSEVTGQLIRTFENIKNWTNLSIPSGLQFRCSTVVLQELFDTVERSVNNYHGDDVALEFRPSALSVRGDRQLLEIMLRNLVNNAIQHTEKGSVTVNAESYTDDPRFVCVTVHDTGSGMTTEQIEDLFRSDKKNIRNPEQYKIKDTQLTISHGSGFGLILCRYIVKKHDDNTVRGCRIWAESEPGKGSTFHFLVAKSES